MHESGHAVLAWASRDAEPLRRVSIAARDDARRDPAEPPEDRHLHTRAELEARLVVMLGGFAAERVVLGDLSTGAEHDLQEATRLSSKMVAHYGMSELGPVHYDVYEEHLFLGKRVAGDRGTSEATLDAIERGARKLLDDALASATELVVQHRAKLDALAHALVERETLERDELEAVLG